MASRDLIGPALPPNLAAAAVDSGPVAGPALPPDYKENSKYFDTGEKCVSAQMPKETDLDSEEDKDLSPVPRKQRRCQEEDDDGFFGPALPPGFKKQDESPERPIIGPALPPGFKKSSEEAEEKPSYQSQSSDSSEEEEETFGPMPAKGSVESNPGAEIEDRARRMKERLLGHDDDGSKEAKRESWMVDLPPELKGFGLGPRTFKRRANDASGDRSIWTDTPADREKKAKEQQEAKKPVSKDSAESCFSERDRRLAEQLSSYNDTQRSESLLDIHRKKLKSKTAGDQDKPQERRPFDRDQDLQVHQIDEARKKAIIKQSRDLNTRFSHGKCNTFL
ncbi:GPALPP motifs-containing protein 1 [Protobothrops mucrosquamatus]|uniref:GPALPP motifs-containing protein 1 n=1 Tax=Protobothrops mucrosquamatus TaxID=103944 RepID=UPI000775EE4C|nr:GPALPP motifs-containing protein 1 [Protobothrops mucrosquamatus]